MPKKVDRLYESFRPENYQLEIDLDKKNKKFRGTVVISGFKTGRPSKRFTFHQKALKISSAKITLNDKTGEKNIPVERINTQDSLNELRIHSSENIYSGKYTIQIKFSGNISDIMVGLYPCYFNKNGKKDWLIATQFESHHAREAFPCIDEPEAKATFDLTIITSKNEKILSNTEPATEKITNLKKQVTFETTPRMSCYLLAWVVGDIHGIKSQTKDGVVVRTWASAAQPKSFLEFANSEAVKILEFFSEYFQTPFPLKKLDQVALPDFEVGAMENWGLVTYREAALLTDPHNRSVSTEQYVAMVVGHELSHQWFGNLVTMRWWDDLWLNESFASIMEHIALDNLHPDWFQWETFMSMDVIAASNRDNYKDVQPVSLQINHPDEINTIFDGAIVYAKGARLLKMLYDYIGEDAMREGLKNYFKKYAYKNTVRNDLWKELSEASIKNIDQLMTPWLIKSGMPEISISRKDNILSISQKRFLLDGEDKTSLWPVPLLSDHKLSADLLENAQLQIEYSEKTEPVLNYAGSGHYIVNYADNETQENIRSKVSQQKIPSTGRINVLNDMLLLCQKGDNELGNVMKIVEASHQEPRDAVWSMFLRAVGQAQLLTEGNKTTEENIKKFKVSLANFWYEKLGWDDRATDDPNTKMLRNTALGLSLSGESKAVINIALSKYQSADKLEDLPSEQRAMIGSTAIKFSKDPSLVAIKLMKEYESTNNPDNQQSLASALCSIRDQELAKEIIDWGLRKNGAVRAQDYTRWFVGLIRNKYVRGEAWQWLEEEWEKRYEELGGPKTLPYFIRYSAGTINTADRYSEFKNFFEPKLADAGLARDIKVAFATIESQIAWRKREEKNLQSYFKSVQ